MLVIFVIVIIIITVSKFSFSSESNCKWYRILLISGHLENSLSETDNKKICDIDHADLLYRYYKNILLCPQVIDHYENPRNVGSLDKNDSTVGTGLVGAPACGDVMKLQVKVDENGKIIDAKFKTFGCGSAIASSSLATEWVKGKTVSVQKVIFQLMLLFFIFYESLIFFSFI